MERDSVSAYVYMRDDIPFRWTQKNEFWMTHPHFPPSFVRT